MSNRHAVAAVDHAQATIPFVGPAEVALGAP